MHVGLNFGLKVPHGYIDGRRVIPGADRLCNVTLNSARISRGLSAQKHACCLVFHRPQTAWMSPVCVEETSPSSQCALDARGFRTVNKCGVFFVLIFCWGPEACRFESILQCPSCEVPVSAWGPGPCGFGLQGFKGSRFNHPEASTLKP